MEMFYFLAFGGFSVVVAALECSKNNKDRIITSPTFNSFKNNYIVVYSLMMGMLKTLAFFILFDFWIGIIWICFVLFLGFGFGSNFGAFD